MTEATTRARTPESAPAVQFVRIPTQPAPADIKDIAPIPGAATYADVEELRRQGWSVLNEQVTDGAILVWMKGPAE